MNTTEYIYIKPGSRVCRQLTSLIILATILANCKKFVVVPPPDTQLVTASVFDNSATATGAMTNIYTQMGNNNGDSYSRALESGLLSDELTNYLNYPYNTQLYTNSMLVTLNFIFGPWANAYNYIYQANAIIAALQNNTAIAPAINQQLTGEAIFVRAFWYFYLVNCYGDVPLTSTTDFKTNALLARSPKAQVYAQIIADLQEAKAKLSSNYVDVSDTTTTTERVRPTKWAATALLARVYLYTENWSEAQAQADTVIGNSGLYNLEPDLDNVFLANSREAIWQLGVPGPFGGMNTMDGQYFILTSAPGGGASQVTISPWLLNAFETGDSRKTNWIGVFTDTTVIPAKSYYYPYKYKVQYSTATAPTEYTMVLRLAEQFLIRAEARAEQGDLAGAAADLNSIRNRAGLANTTANTQADLLAAILHERQVELFTEWGNRWFDLIRTGNVNAVLGPPGNICQAKGGVWSNNGYQTLYPIPLSEIQNDRNLIQNAGYH